MAGSEVEGDWNGSVRTPVRLHPGHSLMEEAGFGHKLVMQRHQLDPVAVGGQHAVSPSLVP